jgi:hypothetical protein
MLKNNKGFNEEINNEWTVYKILCFFYNIKSTVSTHRRLKYIRVTDRL